MKAAVPGEPGRSGEFTSVVERLRLSDDLPTVGGGEELTADQRNAVMKPASERRRDVCDGALATADSVPQRFSPDSQGAVFSPLGFGVDSARCLNEAPDPIQQELSPDPFFSGNAGCGADGRGPLWGGNPDGGGQLIIWELLLRSQPRIRRMFTVGSSTRDSPQRGKVVWVLNATIGAKSGGGPEFGFGEVRSVAFVIVNVICED